MKLAELVALETAFALRGYRVVFERNAGSSEAPDWVLDELTRDDGNGWETAQDALHYAERLTKVAASTLRNLAVIGPDGAAHGDNGGPADGSNDGAAQGALPSEAAIDAAAQGAGDSGGVATPAGSLPVRRDEPREDLGLCLLAGSPMTDWCLVGAQDGDVYAVETARLKAWSGQAAGQGGRRIRWKMRKPTGTVLVGTDEVVIRYVEDPVTGLAAHAGFHGPSGQWWSAPVALGE